MISLRKIEPEDLPYLYQWENDAQSWADGGTHNPLSHQDLRNYIESTTGDIYRDGQLRLIIERLSVDCRSTVGCVDIFDMDNRNRKAALGLYIAPPFRGQGIGKEVVSAIESFAFRNIMLKQIYAIIGVHNFACTHLFESMNYKPTAKLLAWTQEGDAIVWQKFNVD